MREPSPPRINLAAAAYVENCGPDLAARAWREAGDAQERYQLLSSFIAFSPESFAEFMPKDFEIRLWDELGESTHEQKVVGLVSSFDLLKLVEEHRFTMKNPPAAPKRRPKRQ